METQQRIEDLEGRVGKVELRLEGVEDNYARLDEHTQSLHEKQIRMDEVMRQGFDRGESQNKQILSSLSKVVEKQDRQEEVNQTRHEQVINMVAQGDKQNSVEAQAGDRRNYEAFAQRTWDAKALFLTVAITVVVTIPAVIGVWKFIFK